MLKLYDAYQSGHFNYETVRRFWEMTRALPIHFVGVYLIHLDSRWTAAINSCIELSYKWLRVRTRSIQGKEPFEHSQSHFLYVPNRRRLIWTGTREECRKALESVGVTLDEWFMAPPVTDSVLLDRRRRLLDCSSPVKKKKRKERNNLTGKKNSKKRKALHSLFQELAN